MNVGCRGFGLGLWMLLVVGSAFAQPDPQYHVFGHVLDCASNRGLPGVEVEIYYSPLASGTNDDNILATTKTDTKGGYSFDNLPGELEGHVRILELSGSYVAPLKQNVRLHMANTAREVNFFAGPAATLKGTLVITNGTADLTKFSFEVNATEAEVAADGTFLIPSVPVCQKIATLVYQDGHYFDERQISLPKMNAGETNTLKLLWHRPANSVSKEGILKDVNGGTLAEALIQFLGQKSGIFVGMKTSTNGYYKIYDLPKDCYDVRAFVGRYGLEQRALKSTEKVLCIPQASSLKLSK